MRYAGTILLASLAILGIIAGTWLATNYEPQRIGIIFTVLSVITLIVALLARPIERLFKMPGETGTSAPLRPLKQFVYGVLLGFVPIFLSIVTPLSIGLPSLALSLGGKFFISTFVAPLIEEPFFLYVIPFLVLGFFTTIMRNRFLAYIITFALAALLFAIYHWLAYGATFLVSGAFMGAAVFRIITLLVVLALAGKGYSPEIVGRVIIATMVMHVMFNAYIFTRALSITGA